MHLASRSEDNDVTSNLSIKIMTMMHCLKPKVSFTEFYEMVTGGNSPPPGLGGTGGPPAGGGGGTAGGNALAMTAPLGPNVVQQRNKKKQVCECQQVSTGLVSSPTEHHHHRPPQMQRLSLWRELGKCSTPFCIIIRPCEISSSDYL